MKWFEGSINEAVAASKSRKAIFVVFVEGKDEASAYMNRLIQNTEVSSRLEQEDFVAIRIERDSENYTFFAQIYRLVPFPSMFFIGENGVPLRIISGYTTMAELLTEIDAVLIKAGKIIINPSASLIDAEQKASASNAVDNASTSSIIAQISSNISEVDMEATLMKEEDMPVDNMEAKKDDAKVEASTSWKVSEVEMTKSESKESTQVKELTAKEKLEKDQVTDTIKNLERCGIEKDPEKTREEQRDLKIKQAHEERMREKAAQLAARMEVREQIAQDKLERKNKELAFQQQMQQQKQNQEQPKAYVPTEANNTITRIQFRLPSGNPHIVQFELGRTLGELRSYVNQNIELPFRQFILSTSFPRRNLTQEDDAKTLLELGLVPTAVIFILPLKNSNITSAVTSVQDGILSRFAWLFFVPIMSVYNYVVGYFLGDGRRNTERQRGGDSAGARENNPGGAAFSTLPNIANPSGLFRRPVSTQRRTTIRAEGNVHRLHSGGDESDENNTWNGNSTQQM